MNLRNTALLVPIALLATTLSGCNTPPAADAGPTASLTRSASPAAVRGDEDKLHRRAEELKAWEASLRERERELEAWERKLEERTHFEDEEDRGHDEELFHAMEEALGDLWHEVEEVFHEQQEQIGHHFEMMHEGFGEAMRERAEQVDHRFEMVQEMVGEAMGHQAEEFSRHLEEMMERMHHEMRERDHMLEEVHHRINELERRLMESREPRGMHRGPELQIGHPLPGMPLELMLDGGPEGMHVIEGENGEIMVFGSTGADHGMMRHEGHGDDFSWFGLSELFEGQRRRMDRNDRERDRNRDRERDRDRGRDRGHDRHDGRSEAEFEFDMDIETDGARIMMMDGGDLSGDELPEEMMALIMELVSDAMAERGLRGDGESMVRVITRSMNSSRDREDDDDEDDWDDDDDDDEDRRSRRDGKRKSKDKERD